MGWQPSACQSQQTGRHGRSRRRIAAAAGEDPALGGRPNRQPFPPYRRATFCSPSSPGQENFLAGSMGELRPNHFHGGLDIKTDGRVDLPVHAAADGYISRLKQSSFGYGNVLYITHPNGLTTVYGHLNHFKGAVAEDAAAAASTQKRSYELELFFEPRPVSGERGAKWWRYRAIPAARWARTCTGRCAPPRATSSTPCNGAASPKSRTTWRPSCRPSRWRRWAFRLAGGRPVWQERVFVPKAPLADGSYTWSDTITALPVRWVCSCRASTGSIRCGTRTGFSRPEVLVNGQQVYQHTRRRRAVS